MVHSTRHLEQPFQLAARRCPHPIFLDPSVRLSVRVRDTNLTLEAGQRGELSLLCVSEGLAAEGRGRLLKARSCHLCSPVSSLVCLSVRERARARHQPGPRGRTRR
jgi:hypothetical protein